MPQIQTGGAECQLAQLIANSPFDVCHKVFYYSDAKDNTGYKLFDSLSIRYERIPRDKKKPLKFIKAIANAIDKENADIVHCWLFSGNIWGRFGAIKSKCNNIIVAYRNCDNIHGKKLWLLERFTGKYVNTFGNSIAVAKQVGKMLNISIDRIKVINNGIDIQLFNKMVKEQLKFNNDNMLNNEFKTVLMAGRLSPQKNYDMFIKIAQRANSEQLPLQFIIAGAGELESEILDKIKAYNIENIVHLIGVRSDLPYVMKNVDYFCFTTLYEGFPNVLVEAMATGLPIITTKFIGFDELITDGKNGHAVKINDVESAVLILKKYIADDSAAKELGRNASNYIKDNLSIEKMVEETVSYYYKILNTS